MSVPISQGLIAMYTADSWRPAESPAAASWMDLSGAGNHVTDIGGSISVARPVGAPAYVHGDSAAWMRFPALCDVHSVFRCKVQWAEPKVYFLDGLELAVGILQQLLQHAYILLSQNRCKIPAFALRRLC